MSKIILSQNQNNNLNYIFSSIIKQFLMFGFISIVILLCIANKIKYLNLFAFEVYNFTI